MRHLPLCFIFVATACGREPAAEPETTNSSTGIVNERDAATPRPEADTRPTGPADTAAPGDAAAAADTTAAEGTAVHDEPLQEDAVSLAADGDATPDDGVSMPDLPPAIIARIEAGTPGCVGLSEDGKRILSIASSSEQRQLRFADLSSGKGRLREEMSWPWSAAVLGDENFVEAVEGAQLAPCSEVAGAEARIEREVPITVRSDDRTATIAVDGNHPVTVELAHETGRWGLESTYFAADRGDVYLRLSDEDDEGRFALAVVTAVELGQSECVPRPVKDKPLKDPNPPPFSAGPPETSCVAMTADGTRAAFKTWRISRIEGEQSVPNAIEWFGPGAVTPEIDLSCMAYKRCDVEQQAALEARAAELGLTGCARARGALMVDGKLSPFMYKDNAIKLLGGSGWRDVHELQMGAHDGEPHEALWKVFQRPRGGPIFLYIGDSDTGYETVLVRVLDEEAMNLCPKAPADSLQVVEVLANSTRRSSYGYRYRPRQVIDGDLTTSWQPKNLRKGENAWIELKLDGEHEVTGLEIANGFQRRDGNGDLFVANARAAEVQVTHFDGTSERIELGSGARGLQRVSLKPHRTTSVRLTILGIHPGTRWPRDIAISELRVLGR